MGDGRQKQVSRKLSDTSAWAADKVGRRLSAGARASGGELRARYTRLEQAWREGVRAVEGKALPIPLVCGRKVERAGKVQWEPPPPSHSQIR